MPRLAPLALLTLLAPALAAVSPPRTGSATVTLSAGWDAAPLVLEVAEFLVSDWGSKCCLMNCTH